MSSRPYLQNTRTLLDEWDGTLTFGTYLEIIFYLPYCDKNLSNRHHSCLQIEAVPILEKKCVRSRSSVKAVSRTWSSDDSVYVGGPRLGLCPEHGPHVVL